MEVHEASRLFAELLSLPEAEIALDGAAVLIAAHADPALEVAPTLARIDDLAERCYAPTLDALVRHLWEFEGFRGNRENYFDPRNSLLHEVLERRLGIPISLAVVALSVGRRIGVPIAGVSMPGHFLLRDKVDRSVFVDPFDGRVIDQAGCEARFRSVHGPASILDPAELEPVGNHVIIARILANLRLVYRQRNDSAALTWVLRLRALVPGVPTAERAELAELLVARGDIIAAAIEFERLADMSVDSSDGHRARARALRSRLN